MLVCCDKQDLVPAGHGWAEGFICCSCYRVLTERTAPGDFILHCSEEDYQRIQEMKKLSHVDVDSMSGKEYTEVLFR